MSGLLLQVSLGIDGVPVRVQALIDLLLEPRVRDRNDHVADALLKFFVHVAVPQHIIEKG